MTWKRRCVIALLSSSAAACMPQAATQCASGQGSVHETLYFGTGKLLGVVTSQEWAAFVKDSITPQFPSGFSVFSASGQWRGTDGAIVKEATYVLDLVHADDSRSEAAVGELVTSYKAQFGQEAVLRIKTRACVSF